MAQPLNVQLRAIFKFCGLIPAQILAMSYIYNLLQDKEKLDQLIAKAFKKIDTNESKFLEMNEIEEVMINLSSEMLIDEPTKDEIEELIRFLDPD